MIEKLRAIRPKLTERQINLVLYYYDPTGDTYLNGSQSAIKAGYSQSCARLMASKLLSRKEIRFIANEKYKEHEKTQSITAEYITDRLLEIANKAESAGKYSDAIASLNLIGKTKGLFIDVSRQTSEVITKISDDEIDEIKELANRYNAAKSFKLKQG